MLLSFVVESSPIDFVESCFLWLVVDDTAVLIGLFCIWCVLIGLFMTMVVEGGGH